MSATANDIQRLLAAGRTADAEGALRSKLAKDPAQMGLTEHDQVVETFPSDRADQSLRVPILPRRACGNWFVADTHSA